VTPLLAWVDGIGVHGPGLAGWSCTQAVLTGAAAFTAAPTVLPVPMGLPPAERRRTGRAVKVALAAGFDATAFAGADPGALPAVFASSGGDGENCHAICQVLASGDRQISPTRFHNSVHNAAAGYWGIATGSMATATALGAHDASFAAGLLEAMAQLACDTPEVLLVAYDTDYPEPLFTARPITDAFGVALLLRRAAGAQSLARLAVTVAAGFADRAGDPELEALRRAIPAARCLPLLDLLAHRIEGSARLEYLEPLVLAVAVTPCG
jgi:hypothetical protein